MRNKRFILTIIGVSAIIKLVIMAAYFHLWLAPGSKDLIGPDGEGFSQRGWYIAKVLRGEADYRTPSREFVFEQFNRVVDFYKGELPPFNSRANGLFTYFIGFVYYLFGYRPFLIKAVNILINAASSIVLYSLASKIYNKEIAKTAFVVFTFFPTLFIFSISALRDPLVILCILAIIHTLVGHAKNIAPKTILALFPALTLLLFLREELFIIMTAAVVFTIIRKQKMKFKIIALLVLPAMLLGVTKVPIFYRIRSRPMVLIKNIAPMAFVKNAGLYHTGGRLAYKTFPDRYYEDYKRYASDDEYINSPERITLAGLIKAMPRAVLSYLTRPFPFIHKDPVYTLISFSMIWWYAVLGLSILGIVRPRHASIYPIVVYTGMILILTSIVNANEGILLRHRDMIAPFFILFASAGIDSMRKRTVTDE